MTANAHERWSVAAHCEAAGRRFSLSVELLRFASRWHATSWTLGERGGGFHAGSALERGALAVLASRLMENGGNPALAGAARKLLDRGAPLRPDRLLAEARVLDDGLDFGVVRLSLGPAGRLELADHDDGYGCDLRLLPTRARIVEGARWWQPRLMVSGTLRVAGSALSVDGVATVDHAQAAPPDGTRAWIRLDDGSDLFVDADGLRVCEASGPVQVHDFACEPSAMWRSLRTLDQHPTQWRVRASQPELDLTLCADRDDQEIVTLLSGIGFWRGSVTVRGALRDRRVQGDAIVEHKAPSLIGDLDDLLRSMSAEVRVELEKLVPLQPTAMQVRNILAREDSAAHLDGVDRAQFARVLSQPLREITDRGGKGWRSHVMLAACGAVGGDIRPFAPFLAMTELLQTGSLIIDDVEDRSLLRRGGPTCHVVHGDAIAINAGTACFFIAPRVIETASLAPAVKLRLYELYFETLRLGHVGQGLDIDGVDRALLARTVDSGDADELEGRVLAVNRLKTALPVSALGQMGAIIGGGTDAQVRAIGRLCQAAGEAFQIVDDILNLRGFEGDLKTRGEDITHGKITLIVAEALRRLPHAERQWLHRTFESRPGDEAVIKKTIALLEECGALVSCERRAREMVVAAWREADPLLEDSIAKLTLQVSTFFLLERLY
jgi:geranylgeranyl pyrophosphate synthase